AKVVWASIAGVVGVWLMALRRSQVVGKGWLATGGCARLKKYPGVYSGAVRGGQGPKRRC
ncbi:MAG: hypothetical protein ACRES5_34200, partial [Pseudomonas sp.]